MLLKRGQGLVRGLLRTARMNAALPSMSALMYSRTKRCCNLDESSRIAEPEHLLGCPQVGLHHAFN